MLVVYNQPGKFFPTERTYKSSFLDNTIIENLKLSPITRSWTGNALKTVLD